MGKNVRAPAKDSVATNLQQLQQLPLLQGLSEYVLAQVAAHTQVQVISRGHVVVRKGDKDAQMLFVLRGRLQVIDLSEDGREVGLNFLTAGEYFGELSVIDGLPRSATVVATENSMIAVLPRPYAMDLIYKNPSVIEDLLKKMARSIRRASSYQGILSIPNAFHRVFALLNQMTCVAPGGLVVIDNIPTQHEISIMVNTSRETVSRAMRFLIEKGIVEKDLRRLIIRKPVDLDGIYKSAEGGNGY
ncbi:MAG: Crp/Fnr family transcriptional regulator [Rhodoferax sp.]|nr:Crp/Fnr family transcriptional regulator [Rhodoferax sp.]